MCSLLGRTVSQSTLGCGCGCCYCSLSPFLTTITSLLTIDRATPLISWAFCTYCEQGQLPGNIDNFQRIPIPAPRFDFSVPRLNLPSPSALLPDVPLFEPVRDEHRDEHRDVPEAPPAPPSAPQAPPPQPSRGRSHWRMEMEARRRAARGQALDGQVLSFHQFELWFHHGFIICFYKKGSWLMGVTMYHGVDFKKDIFVHWRQHNCDL